MDFSAKRKILVTCSKGISPILEEELRLLGFPIHSAVTLGVFTEGSLTDTIALNFQLRTGLRVLYFLDDFRAVTPEDMYQAVTRLPWEDVLAPDGYVCVTSSVSNDYISDFRFANVRCKDAIVDRIKAKKGRRPDSGNDRSKAVVFLYWQGDYCAVYVDTSGESLSKRGYRKIPYKAPMQETLAAAVLSATKWNGRGHVVNPMCGSGTLAIEAAMMAMNRAPGLLRHNFGYMHLIGYFQEQYHEIRSRIKSLKTSPSYRFIASDIDSRAIQSAKQNALTAGVADVIEFHQCDFRSSPVPDNSGIVVINPAYGIRLDDNPSLDSLYKDIGDFFKRKCQGYRGFIFSGNLELIKKVGLKPKKRMMFYNGRIESRLVEYELYSGSRRAKNHTV